MNYESITIRDLGPFEGTHTFDLTGLEGTITSITGPNGAGKTTLVELLFAGIYRTLITRGSKQHTLASLSTSRDSLLEVCAGGYRFRHLVDGVSGKSDAVVLDASGEPLTNGKGVRDFDRWVDEHMPPAEVVLSGLFSHQGGQGFIQAGAADRKSVLLRLLGLEHLEQLAKGAREKARSADDDHATARRELETEEERGTKVVQQLQTAHEQAQQGKEAQEQDLDRLASERRLAGEAREACASRALEIQTWDSEHARLEEACTRCNTDITRAERKRAGLQELLTRGDEIQLAAEAESALTAERDTLQEQRAEMLDQHGKLRVQEHAARTLLHAAVADLARSEEADSGLAEARGTVERLTLASSQLDEAKQALESSRRYREELRANASTSLQRRVAALRDALTDVKEVPWISVTEVRDRAGEALEADDSASVATERLPELLAATDLAITQHAQRVGALDEQARALPAAETRLAELELEAKQLHRRRNEQVDCSERALELQAKLADVSTEGKAVSQRLEDIRGQLGLASPLARKLPLLLSARETQTALEHDLDAHRAKLQELTAAGMALPPRPDPLPAVDLRSLDDRIQTLHTDLRRSEATLASCAEKLARAKDSCVAADDLRDRVAQVAEQARLWNRLARDLGKDGLQASVVDSALPELTTSANDLLYNCFGSRFSLELRTQSADAKGVRLLETLDVIVHDALRGRQDTVESYSGGEKTIVSEALALAIAQMTCRNSGLEGSTLIRDEAGGALDPVKGQQWVEMMRRAAGQVGCRRVLFISHDPVCQSLGDSRLQLAGPE